MAEQAAPPMDPDVTLFAFVQACAANDRPLAGVLLDSLCRWIERGGRLPLTPE